MATNWKEEDLIFACYGRNYPQAIELLEMGADPNVRPPEEWWEDDPDKWKEFCTPLHYACKHGELEFIKLLVEKYKCSLNIRDGHIRSPLHIACQYGHLDVARYIIEHMGDLSLLKDLSNSKMTPLHYACQNGRTEVVEYLVSELGCQLDVFDRESQTPLHYACEKGYTRIAICLCEHGSKLEVQDRSQSTPLHLASKFGNTDIVKYLLDHGCDPDATDNIQWTPLHYACQYGYVEIVKSLHAHNCNLESTDDNQFTPLHVAVNNWKCIDELSLDVVKYLISVAHVKRRTTSNGDDALLLASREGRLPIMQFLAIDGRYDVSVQDKDGNTPLHFACQRSKAYNWKPIIKWLLEEGGSDPNVKNNAGQTPFQLVTDNGVRLDLLRHGATPSDVYEQYGRGLGLRQPLQPSLDLFVVGSYSAGKSTLMIAFRKISSRFMSIINRRRRVSGGAKTAGIIPQEFKTKKYGHISLFDCAGRKEFHDSHAAVLNNAVQCVPPVFVIVVNLNQSHEEIHQDVIYWLSLLESQCSSCSNVNVVIVGSHADVLLARREDPSQKLEGVVATLPRFKSFDSPAFIAMNCQCPESAEMTQLRRIVKTSCDATQISEMIHFNTHCLYTYIVNQFRGSYAVPLRQVQANVQNKLDSATEHDVIFFLPSSLSALHKICKELNDQTHLLYLINTVTIQNSWIVIKKSALLSEVIGTIFAPVDFKQHGQLASGTGIVPLSKITQKFRHYDPEMLVGFLSTLEHCLELTYQQIIESFPQHSESGDFNRIMQQHSPNDRYLLFPGLVTLEAPSDVWQIDPQYSHYCGWILQCSHANQFFTLHFIRALILRLVNSLALTDLDTGCNNTCNEDCAAKQECILWKNGLHWKNNCGVEALVEEVSQSKEIVLLVRCSEDCILNCLRVRSHIIRNILKAASEMCGNVDTTQSFIDPAETMKHPLKPTSHVDLFKLTDIAKAVVTSTPSVVSMSGKTLALEEVTMFNAYAGLGEHLLCRLFDEHSYSYYCPLPDVLINQIAKEISHEKKEKFVEIFKADSASLPSKQDTTSTNEVDVIGLLQLWRESRNGTLQLLRETLDQYSVFSGDSPLVLIGSDAPH